MIGTSDLSRAACRARRGRSPGPGGAALRDADIQISITFPGEVVQANGEVDGNTVTYVLEFGSASRSKRRAARSISGRPPTWSAAATVPAAAPDHRGRGRRPARHHLPGGAQLQQQGRRRGHVDRVGGAGVRGDTRVAPPQPRRPAPHTTGAADAARRAATRRGLNPKSSLFGRTAPRAGREARSAAAIRRRSAAPGG